FDTHTQRLEAQARLGVLTNNVKFGVSVSYPLLNRKARGAWQVSRLKWQDSKLALDQKRRAVDLKFGQYANELDNYAAQLLVFNDLRTSYRVLLDAEQEKFRFGESSVFLINTREQRWLDAQIKYQKLLGEYFKTEAALRWSAGVLDE
ncbi:MAG TPA: TolC family protein, partial [Saprospiraceae bacterium]|nr:TolC family protein [Saprospiraceae bacterium]